LLSIKLRKMTGSKSAKLFGMRAIGRVGKKQEKRELPTNCYWGTESAHPSAEFGEQERPLRPPMVGATSQVRFTEIFPRTLLLLLGPFYKGARLRLEKRWKRGEKGRHVVSVGGTCSGSGDHLRVFCFGFVCFPTDAIQTSLVRQRFTSCMGAIGDQADLASALSSV